MNQCEKCEAQIPHEDKLCLKCWKEEINNLPPIEDKLDRIISLLESQETWLENIYNELARHAI
jgi:hypothetical protein